MFRSVTASLAVFATTACLAFGASTYVKDITVNHRDLDLSNQGDAVTLLNRIERSAVQACGDGIGTVVHSRCVAMTTSNAVAKLDNAMVTQAYVARHGRQPSRFAGE